MNGLLSLYRINCNFNEKCSVTEANEGRKMSLQEAASQAGRRATKFCPANVQKIKDFAAQGMSRQEIAEFLDVPLGSLQVTCSRLGISCGGDVC